MLISTSKRTTRLSEDGRLPGTGAGVHVGPGFYSQDSHTIAARKKRAGFAGFGSSSSRELVTVKEGPGPGRFQKNQFAFKAKKRNKKNAPSASFRANIDRFAMPKPESNVQGPGYYAPQKSDFDIAIESSKMGRGKGKGNGKGGRRGPALVVEPKRSVPSVPRYTQSFGYGETQDGTLELHPSEKETYGGAKFGNHNDVNDRTNWISRQLQDTVGPAYYDRPDASSFGVAMAKKSKPGKSVCRLKQTSQANAKTRCK